MDTDFGSRWPFSNSPLSPSASTTGENTLLEKLRKDYNYPGLAAASSRHRDFASAVTGLRRIDAPPKITKDDQFHLASNTKAMTATTFAMVVKDGHLHWDSTLEEAIPSLADSMAEEHKSTTVKMLTSHRSGIDIDWAADAQFYESLYKPDISPKQARWLMVEKALGEPPVRTKGKFCYDNTNYLITAAIIELITGSSWEDFVRSRLFEPLGMQHTGFGPNDETNDTSIRNPWPHRWVSEPYGPAEPVSDVDFDHRDKPPAFNPAARVHSPMAQYNKFLQAHIDGANGLDTSLGLSQDMFKFLHTPYADDDIYTPGGWHCQQRNKDGKSYSISHSGSNRYNYVVAYAIVGGEDEGTYMVMANIGGIGVGDGLRKIINDLIAGDLPLFSSL
ncbi:beta-lactamase [Cladophialophora psammophila CBS 110553]|uniref:Beta-lactamase n=1 Tax=Cladophialophora psammophila CBS 110553 TaxID=1182543 RepID=W9WEZ0_9EURO|nr:beta-lactamase [Cladophialophora psammophila CBS 110553]EXJ66682.1 beta-lactamase [Cladophialophora psammophila CBS 110553]